MVRVHLGCGRRRLEGWVNVDMDGSVGADVIDDVTTLSCIEDGSAELIYASHVLEHTGRWVWKDVLGLWARKLAPGGILRVAVPDFGAAVEWYGRTGDLGAIMGLTSGGQRSPLDVHYVVFDERSLREGLESAGLVDVERWDWRKVDHGYMDDYSQAYLPHMDKENGLLVSLNLQAHKKL